MLFVVFVKSDTINKGALVLAAATLQSCLHILYSAWNVSIYQYKHVRIYTASMCLLNGKCELAFSPSINKISDFPTLSLSLRPIAVGARMANSFFPSVFTGTGPPKYTSALSFFSHKSAGLTDMICLYDAKI